jgi:hypothetical protein
VQLDNGEWMSWTRPEPVAFLLIHAREAREKGARERRRIMASLVPAYLYFVRPSDDASALDCVAALSTAVVLSFMAVEALANAAVDALADDATIERKGRTYDKHAMVRLSVEDKYR